MRSREEIDAALALVARGFNDCEISRQLRIPRSTIRDWRHDPGRATRRARVDSSYECSGGHDFSTLPGRAYCYLLGMYLGDGCISYMHRGVWRLRISLDGRYPLIIDACSAAIETIMPSQRTYRLARCASRCVELSMCSKHWRCLFPQHGPGRKHTRPIELTDWQVALVSANPEHLVRGLIHSDGCWVVANDRGVASVLYHFSNLSEDIKRIFCDTLDLLSVHWTRPCDRQIAIYRKADVARLDEFIGPKR
jgi:hypothetical protein